MLANVNTIALGEIDGRLDEMNKNGHDNIEQDSPMDEKYAYIKLRLDAQYGVGFFIYIFYVNKHWRLVECQRRQATQQTS